MKIGIYIHIPFCASRCYYCDFCSMENVKEELVEKYITSLCEEIIQNAEILAQNEVDTIYIGGGTPSVIDAKHIEKILYVLSSCTNILENAEITIEVNPESVTKQKFELYKKCGINRISMGLQSIDENVLKAIGRIATKEMYEKAYTDAVDVGFTNISTDVICGLPLDTKKGFKETVEYILKHKYINHISAYSLEVHKNSRLEFLIKNGYLTLPTEETEREMKYLLDTTLENSGVKMYEISNYAKEGFESQHNLKYWQGEPYLGFGVSSASYINSTRYSNTNDIQEYIDGVRNLNLKRKEIEELDLLDLQKEFVILGLRLTEGISIREFKTKFKMDIYDVFKEEIEKNIEKGLLEKIGDRLKLTHKGRDLANVVWQEFI